MLRFHPYRKLVDCPVKQTKKYKCELVHLSSPILVVICLLEDLLAWILCMSGFFAVKRRSNWRLCTVLYEYQWTWLGPLINCGPP